MAQQQQRFDFNNMAMMWINEGDEPKSVQLKWCSKKPSAKGNFTWVVGMDGQDYKIFAQNVLHDKLKQIGFNAYCTIAQEAKDYWTVMPSGNVGPIVNNVQIPEPVQPVQLPNHPNAQHGQGKVAVPAQGYQMPLEQEFEQPPVTVSATPTPVTTITHTPVTPVTPTPVASQSAGKTTEVQENQYEPTTKSEWYEKEIRDFRARALGNIMHVLGTSDSFQANPIGHLDSLPPFMDRLLGHWMNMVVNGSEQEQKPDKLVIINKIIAFLPRPMGVEHVASLENTIREIATTFNAEPTSVHIEQPADYAVINALLDLSIPCLETVLAYYGSQTAPGVPF